MNRCVNTIEKNERANKNNKSPAASGNTGSVTLVGAGCGRGLITLKGFKILQQAEVLVYDDLLDPELLRAAPKDCEILYVGKRFGRHSSRQEEINALLIEKAREGKRVVRLKGGDSFVFGRGGEEILALQKAEIPYAVVPGVSSAIAVPENCGIPVTHRQAARSFTVITGHTAAPGQQSDAVRMGSAAREAESDGSAAWEAESDGKAVQTSTAAIGKSNSRKIATGKGNAAISEDLFGDPPGTWEGENYEALAKLRGTLVFLMGMHAIPQITAGLIHCGKDPKTPAAVLSQGFTANQTRYDGTLKTIAEIARREHAGTPGILLIGPTAGYHMEGTFRRPLEDVRVTVTGTEAFTAKLESKLELLGADVTRIPCLAIVPRPDRVPDSFKAYQWIAFTSTNGVRLFFDTLRERGTDLRGICHLKFAVIGAGTADALAKYGFRADFVPSMYTSEVFGRELAQAVQDADQREYKKRESRGERNCSQNAGDLPDYSTDLEESSQGKSSANLAGKVLILRAQEGAAALTEELEKAQISFDDVKIYGTSVHSAIEDQSLLEETMPTEMERTQRAQNSGDPLWRQAAEMGKKTERARCVEHISEGQYAPCGVEEPKYLLFSSAAGVRAYLAGGYADNTPASTKLIAIGPATAEELRKHTDIPFITAREHTADGMIREILLLEENRDDL